jgi:parvulin-like peptidyl-prolyl isomerase
MRSRLLAPLSPLLILPFLTACPSGKEGKQGAADAGAGPSAMSDQEDLAKMAASKDPLARVNGVDIPRTGFLKEFKLTLDRYAKARHAVTPALRERLKDNLVYGYVDYEILRQHAEQMQVAVPAGEAEAKWAEHKKRYGSDESFKQFLDRAGVSAEDVKEQFDKNLLKEKVYDKLAETATVGDSELREYYEKNKGGFAEPEQVRTSHILFRVTPDMKPEDKAKKQKLAKEIDGKAKAKGADFAALARQYCEDGTKEKGGDLGFKTKGQLLPQFEAVAWPMKINEVSNVVETPYGFHVIKKTGHNPARQKPFEEMKDTIEKSIKARKRNEKIRVALQKWKEDAKIEYFVKGDPAIIQAAVPQGGVAGPSGGARIMPGPMVQPVRPGQPGIQVPAGQVQPGLQIRPTGASPLPVQPAAPANSPQNTGDKPPT